MEKSQKKDIIKNILIVVLLCFVVGLSGYVMYDKMLLNKSNQDVKKENKDQEKKNEQEEEVITLSVSDPMIVELYQTLKTGIDPCGIWNYFTKTKVEPGNITNNLAVSIAVNQLSKKGIINKNNSGGNQFTANQLDAEIDRIFGKNYTFQHANFFNFAYNANTGIYQETQVGFGGSCGVSNLDKIVKAEKQGNTLTIYSRVLFHIEGTDATNFYKDYDKTQVVTLDRDANGYVVNSDSNYAKGSLYKMNFILEDGNYIFVSCEPVQD